MMVIVILYYFLLSIFEWGSVTGKDTLLEFQSSYIYTKLLKGRSIIPFIKSLRDVLYVYDGMDAIFPVSIYSLCDSKNLR